MRSDLEWGRPDAEARTLTSDQKGSSRVLSVPSVYSPILGTLDFFTAKFKVLFQKSLIRTVMICSGMLDFRARS